MAALIVLLALLEGVAVPLLAAAFGFDLPAAAHFGSLIDRGPGVAELLRWGALLDMAGYLVFALVVLYVGGRLQQGNALVVSALTVGGLGAVLIGAVGAVLLATIGPSLLLEYATAPASTREAARVALEALGRGVAAGLWGTLELALLGAWLIGVGWQLRQAWPRFGGLALLSGMGMVASSLRTGATGRILVDVLGPVDLVIVLIIVGCLALLFVWLLWLAVSLWWGRPDSPGLGGAS
ncbi:MAG: hypothetical protein WD402_03235 [Chloroflexota bacterium]